MQDSELQLSGYSLLEIYKTLLSFTYTKTTCLSKLTNISTVICIIRLFGMRSHTALITYLTSKGAGEREKREGEREGGIK